MSTGDDPHDGTRRRHAFHRLRVTEIVDDTHDTRTLVFDVPADLSDVYRYSAGQFCTVRVTIDGNEVSRCYSMSSAPATDERLALTVKRVPGGLVSNWLHDHVAAGDELDLMPPAGAFCERPGTSPVLLLCGGSGVTPVFSILKQVLATGERSVRLLDANRDAGSIIFHDALEQLATAHAGRLTVRHHLDSDAGYLTTDDIVAFVGTDTGADVFVCGPTPFMDLVEAALARAGVTPEQVAIERFATPALDASGAPLATEPDAAATAVTERLTVRFKRKRHQMGHTPGDTLLDAARRGGLNPPFSCLQGECATCMALVLEGTVTMRANHVLTDDEVREGWVLTCQAVPTSREVSIEYEAL